VRPRKGRGLWVIVLAPPSLLLARFVGYAPMAPFSSRRQSSLRFIATEQMCVVHGSQVTFARGRLDIQLRLFYLKCVIVLVL